MANMSSLSLRILLGAGSVASILWASACGDDGAKGEPGAMGAQGIPGPAGPPGAAGTSAEAGAALAKPCTTPCHTFNGVVDQWRFSHHSHPQENEIGTGACGNCHAIDGIQNRVAGRATASGDASLLANVERGHISYTNGAAVSEVAYAGASTIGRIHCSTCHRFDETTDPHVTGSYAPGQAPIRVPGGAADVAYIEKSAEGATKSDGQALSLGAANLCVFCHKSRKDATFYVTASNNLSVRWGPHNGPQSDLFSGKGGYPLNNVGETYGTATHTTIANACVSCHMQPVAANGNVPDHTMKPQVAYCKTCHVTYTGTTFDIDSGRSDVRKGLAELQAALNAANLLTRSAAAPYAALTAEELADSQFQLDSAKSPGAPVNAATAGAVYNYLLVARGKDLGVHNPRYTKQLLWDSIRAIKGTTPTFLASRPPS